jgi:outer membrane receptor protein involved in Fe transport
VTRHTVLLLLALALPSIVFAQNPTQEAKNPPPDVPTFKTEVIATTPLPGVDLPLEAIPAPAQTALASDITASGSIDLSDFLNRRLTSVFVNEIQGNPFQPDINYRGYTASPLLGTPQGLSVYMDGVRLNQPFGDVVSWDLIPRAAIASTTLMPGSNPLFGLNTLGGALSVQTKDGRSFRGTSAQVVGGGYGRRSVEFEHGGANASGVDWYFTGNLFHDSGWRAASPSDVRQIFGKIGWRNTATDVHLTGAYADNALRGNSLQEQRLLAADYSSVYTTPDTTNNKATFVNATVRHRLTSQSAISLNGYFRNIRTDTLNGDINEGSLDQSVYQPSAADIQALTAAGYTGFPTAGANAANTPFPFWRCIAQSLQRDEPGEKCDGLLNRTTTTQDNYGVSGQVDARTSGGATSNRFTAGGAFDRSTVVFGQSSQLGYLIPDRSVTAVPGAFADGTSGGSVDGAPFDNRVDLTGTVRTASVYATDTISVNGIWHFTAAGRFNQTAVDNRDGMTPAPGPGSLTGSNTFNRFNPAVGLTVNPRADMNAYVSYSEGSRAPTSVELGCADPTSPCKLPNALAGDPPLSQVVTRTVEAGLRGGRRGISWSAGLFTATNYDDLLFVASTQTGFGYFRNFGRTRRQGVELSAAVRLPRATAGFGYSFVDATYQSAEVIGGAGNSTNDSATTGARGLDGNITISPGDRMPLIPEHTFKAYGDFQATPKLSVDVDLVAAASSFARGNEDNAHQPDSTYYLGPGSSPAYAIVNLGARYRLNRWLEAVAQVNNVFDHHYYSAAQLGPTGLTAAGAYIARPLPAINGEFPVVHSTFYAPGAPTTFWFGARVSIK